MTIFCRSLLNVVDNSGARFVRVVHVYKKHYSLGAIAGNTVLVSVYSFSGTQHMLKKKLYFFLITGTVAWLRRMTGNSIRFSRNMGILLEDHETIIGTRIVRPIIKESYIPYVENLSKLERLVSAMV